MKTIDTFLTRHQNKGDMPGMRVGIQTSMYNYFLMLNFKCDACVVPSKYTCIYTSQ